MSTTEEQLASVQAAIADIEANGQDVSIDGRRYTKADLSILYKREESLLARIRRASGANLFDRARVGVTGRGF